MVTCLLLSALLAPANLVYNGDCELPAPVGPPPGWAMWGAQQFKVPANFTRDTTVAHSGEASLRIHEPAGTKGYLVTDPAYAIRPAEGLAYRVSFWARSDKPGASAFWITGYQSIAPFADAPSPGSWPINVAPEWRRFEFVVREGLDFFAARSAYLLLSFRAQAAAGEERTLWVDDLAVVAEAMPNALRLVDPDTLTLPPLDHGLQRGDRLAVTVDAARPVRPTNRGVGGISFHRLVGWTGQPFDRSGAYTLAPKLERAIADLKLPMTRLYGVGDEPFGIEAALDRAAELCARTGVAPARTILELEDQGAVRRIDPAVWSRAAAYSRAKGYGFRLWEVGNEVYSGLWQPGKMGTAYASPEAYAEQVKAVRDAVRAAQPDAEIGLSLNWDNQVWGNRLLKLAAGSYDFVCPHFYNFGNTEQWRFEDVAIADNQRQIDRARRLLALVKLYNPGRAIPIDDTEWGLHGFDSKGSRADDIVRNANVWGLLHRAVRMIYYARLEGVRGASSWQMLNAVQSPGFGILSQQAPDQRFVLYWLYWHMNRALLDEVMPTRGTAPWYGDSGPLTPVLATRAADGGRLAVVWANAGATPVAAELNIDGATYAQATGVTLSQSDLDAPPLLARTEDLEQPLRVTRDGGRWTCTLPARSVSFAHLTR